MVEKAEEIGALLVVRKLAEATMEVGFRTMSLLWLCFSLYLLEIIGIPYLTVAWTFLTGLPLYLRITIYFFSPVLLLFYIMAPLTSVVGQIQKLEQDSFLKIKAL